MEWLDRLKEANDRRIRSRFSLESIPQDGPEWIEIPVEDLRSGDEIPPKDKGGEPRVVWSVRADGSATWDGPVVKLLRNRGELAIGVSVHHLDAGELVQVLAHNPKSKRGL